MSEGPYMRLCQNCRSNIERDPTPANEYRIAHAHQRLSPR
jgi:hypothetical protein